MSPRGRKAADKGAAPGARWFELRLDLPEAMLDGLLDSLTAQEIHEAAKKIDPQDKAYIVQFALQQRMDAPQGPSANPPEQENDENAQA